MLVLCSSVYFLMFCFFLILDCFSVFLLPSWATERERERERERDNVEAPSTDCWSVQNCTFDDRCTDVLNVQSYRMQICPPQHGSAERKPPINLKVSGGFFLDGLWPRALQISLSRVLFSLQNSTLVCFDLGLTKIPYNLDIGAHF